MIAKRVGPAVIIGLAGLAAAPAGAQDATLAGKLQACHAISGVTERVGCYDRLAVESADAAARAVLVPAVAPVAALPAQPATIAQPTDVSASAPTPTPGPTTAPVTAPPPTSLQAALAAAGSRDIIENHVREITLELSEAERQDGGLFLLVSTEGVVWMQRDNQFRGTPRAGDKMRIEKNILGGYWCILEDKPRFHCTPVRATLPPQ